MRKRKRHKTNTDERNESHHRDDDDDDDGVQRNDGAGIRFHGTLIEYYCNKFVCGKDVIIQFIELMKRMFGFGCTVRGCVYAVPWLVGKFFSLYSIQAYGSNTKTLAPQIAQ